ASYFIHLDSGPARSWEPDGTGFGRLLGGGGRGGGGTSSPEEDLLNTPRPDLLPMSKQLKRANILARRNLELTQRCENPAIFDKRGCPSAGSSSQVGTAL